MPKKILFVNPKDLEAIFPESLIEWIEIQDSVNPPGIHKPNTAAAQAYYNKLSGVKEAARGRDKKALEAIKDFPRP